ncbi:hypothetical protein Lal_00027829 [Lupinus albus]|nr:hypothetical protein Lal_00027829 [Lupinus albus]
MCLGICHLIPPVGFSLKRAHYRSSEKIPPILKTQICPSRPSEGTLAQARHLSLNRGPYSLDRSKMSLFSPKRANSRSGETTLAQASQLSLRRESISIAHDFTLPEPIQIYNIATKMMDNFCNLGNYFYQQL